MLPSSSAFIVQLLLYVSLLKPTSAFYLHPNPSHCACIQKARGAAHCKYVHPRSQLSYADERPFWRRTSIKASPSPEDDERNGVVVPAVKDVDLDSQGTENDPRDAFGRMVRGMVTTGMKQDIDTGSIVIAKADIPGLGIYMDQSYELRSIYIQGHATADDAIVEKIPLASLQDPVRGGYTRYITLFSAMYHKEPVIVTPEEVGLVSLRNEVFDSILFALPVLSFWLFISFSLARGYNEKYGGNFIDALFRT